MNFGSARSVQDLREKLAKRPRIALLRGLVLLGLVGVFSCQRAPIVSEIPPITGAAASWKIQHADEKLRNVELMNCGQSFLISPSVYVGSLPGNASRQELEGYLFGARDGAEDRAIAIWKWIADRRYHYCTAGLGRLTATEPTDIFHGFGYGCCDQIAPLLGATYRSFGFPARVAWMRRHVVTEVFYDGRWHLFDGDTPAYFLTRGPRPHVASLAELAEDPDLVLRSRPPYRGYARPDYLAMIYATDGRDADYRASPDFIDTNGRLVLWPGDRILFQENSLLGLPAFRRLDGNEQRPSRFCAASWIRQVRFDGSHSQLLFSERRVGGGSRVREIRILFTSPYLLRGGEIVVVGRPSKENSGIQFFLEAPSVVRSENFDLQFPIGEYHALAAGSRVLPLNSALLAYLRDRAEASFRLELPWEFRILLSVHGGDSGMPPIEELWVRLEYQCSPFLIPFGTRLSGAFSYRDLDRSAPGCAEVRLNDIPQRLALPQRPEQVSAESRNPFWAARPGSSPVSSPRSEDAAPAQN